MTAACKAGAKKSYGVAAVGFRLIHGQIRLLQHFIRGVVRIAKDGDADAGTAAALASVQDIGFIDDNQDLLGYDLGLGSGHLGQFAQVVEHHDELVPAQPRHRVALADMNANRRATSCSRRSPMW